MFAPTAAAVLVRLSGAPHLRRLTLRLGASALAPLSTLRWAPALQRLSLCVVGVQPPPDALVRALGCCAGLLQLDLSAHYHPQWWHALRGRCLRCVTWTWPPTPPPASVWADATNALGGPPPFELWTPRTPPPPRDWPVRFLPHAQGSPCTNWEHPVSFG